MLTLILLAQLATTPPPTPPPTPIVLAGRVENGGARTLSDFALERRLGKRPTGSGTFSVTGATGMPALVMPAYQNDEQVTAPVPVNSTLSQYVQ